MFVRKVNRKESLILLLSLSSTVGIHAGAGEFENSFFKQKSARTPSKLRKRLS